MKKVISNSYRIQNFRALTKLVENVINKILKIRQKVLFSYWKKHGYCCISYLTANRNEKFNTGLYLYWSVVVVLLSYKQDHHFNTLFGDIKK